jgi:hypothetical protein
MQNALKAADAVLFVAGRIAFERPPGYIPTPDPATGKIPRDNSPGAPSMLLAFGPEAVARLGRAKIAGAFFEAYGAR